MKALPEAKQHGWERQHRVAWDSVAEEVHACAGIPCTARAVAASTSREDLVEDVDQRGLQGMVHESAYHEDNGGLACPHSGSPGMVSAHEGASVGMRAMMGQSDC